LKTWLARGLPVAGLLALTALLAVHPDPPRIPEQAPAFVLPDLQGRPVALESFRGHPLLVNFWGIWCLPCRAELPELERLAAECSGCLAVVGVTLGSGSASDIGAFAAAHAIRYPLLIGDARIMADYHVDSRRQFFGSSPESCVDGCQDLRSRRANGVRRIGVRPAHHALLADEEQRGYGDDVVLLARAALKVHAILAEHLELFALDLVDDVECFDEREITVAENPKGDRIDGFRRRFFLGLFDADRDRRDAALLKLGECPGQFADLEVAVRAPPVSIEHEQDGTFA